MPVPIVAPTPNIESWKRPIVLFSSLSPESDPVSADISGTGLRRKSCLTVGIGPSSAEGQEELSHPAYVRIVPPAPRGWEEPSQIPARHPRASGDRAGSAHADPGRLRPALPAAPLRLAGRGCRRRGRRGSGRGPGRRRQPGAARGADRRPDQLPRAAGGAHRGVRGLRQPRPRRPGRTTASRSPPGCSRTDLGSLHVDGSSVDIGDVRLTVCPWWDGPVTREEVAAQLAAAAVDRPARWVWLYHAPPAGTPLCFDGRRTFPDHDLADWIDEHRPDVVLCGHIHQSPWAEGGSWHARLGQHVGLQRRQADRAGPAAHHPRHRGRDCDWFGVFESETLSLA